MGSPSDAAVLVKDRGEGRRPHGAQSALHGQQQTAPDRMTVWVSEYEVWILGPGLRADRQARIGDLVAVPWVREGRLMDGLVIDDDGKGSLKIDVSAPDRGVPALLAFHRDRLDEDAATAHVAGDARPEWYNDREMCQVTTRDGAWVIAAFASEFKGSPQSIHEADAEHIAQHDPARVLRDIDASRQLMDLHQPWPDHGEASGPDFECTPTTCSLSPHLLVCTTCREEHGLPEPWPCKTARLLVLPFVDHPHYRDEWRP